VTDHLSAQARSFAQALERPKTVQKWQPLPHQLPPQSDWLGWLLMAGRGAGKTEACARFLVDHVNGPPCMNGPVPHWMAIIAPTLGDAATACFSGPSGIRHFAPDAQMSSKVGGLLVTWPNGSQAKMYGARDPDDVERLRAGGNTCLTYDTLVRTENGEIPIQDIRPGDRVWTSRGLRRVLRAACMGMKPVYELETVAGQQLRLTADHVVLTQRGWCETRDLAPNDTIVRWHGEGEFTTTARRGTNAPTATSLTHERDQDCFIVTSGLSVTAPYRHITSSTTALKTTGTRRTSSGWSVSRRSSTPNDTTVGTIPSCVHEQARQLGAIGLLADWRVSIVDRLFPHEECATTSGVVSVRLPDTREEKCQVVHVSDGCALCVATSSSAFDEQPPVLVADRVRHCSLLKFVVIKVYDLQVEHDHEFFANDVLVGNCLAWCEELAAWRYLEDAFDQLRFGLRIGTHPRWIASTTPKPRPLIKKLVKGEIRGVALTHATMYDNPHLPPHIKDALEEAYTGTSIGTQELYGRLVEQDTNALWTRDTIERTRLAVAPPLRRVEVGVDPSGGAGEQGIVVVGAADVDTDGRKLKHGYVLADASVHMKPEGWARTAVTAAVDWEADRIVVETNFGGDQAVALVVNACEKMDVSIPIRTVHASRGKRPRAEPVSAMSIQDRWHMVGRFDELEDQMCTWTIDSGFSPDRIDAMVWPAWSMKLVSTLFHSVGTFGGAQMVHHALGRRRPQ
jgi:phage terminase large subunit-like protein